MQQVIYRRSMIILCVIRTIEEYTHSLLRFIFLFFCSVFFSQFCCFVLVFIFFFLLFGSIEFAQYYDSPCDTIRCGQFISFMPLTVTFTVAHIDFGIIKINCSHFFFSVFRPDRKYWYSRNWFCFKLNIII